MTFADHSADFGVDWVDVTVEPHHAEQFANQAVRIYEATIPPGTATLFHRHIRDTLYVITAGGRFRSEEPGHQMAGTRMGRSTPLRRQLWWLAIRKLGGSWVRMPTGTLIAQPHRTHPLIHRVIAHPANSGPIRMLGVELQRERPVSTRLHGAPGIRVENGGAPWPAYRLSSPPDGQPQHVMLAGGGVLVVVAGSATVEHNGEVRELQSGQARWLAPGGNSIRSSRMDAVLIPL